jgi:hypothetical protein
MPVGIVPLAPSRAVVAPQVEETPAPAPLAPAVVEPPAPPTRPRPSGPVEVPKLFALLFTRGTTYVFKYGWFVDPHSAEPIDRSHTTWRAECKVVEVLEHPGAIASNLECKPLDDKDSEGNTPSPVAELGMSFATDGKGLWIGDVGQTGQDEVYALLDEPMYLKAEPELYATKRDVSSEIGQGVDTEAVFEETIKVPGGKVKAWCRKDTRHTMYGLAEKRCFATKVGLAGAELEGRSGPSEETLTLVSLKTAR